MKYGLCKNSITLVSEQDRIPKCPKSSSLDPKQTHQPEPTSKPATSKSLLNGLSSFDPKSQQGSAKEDAKENLEMQARGAHKGPQKPALQKEMAPEAILSTQPCLDSGVRHSAFVPVGEHRLRGPEDTEATEVLANSTTKASSFHAKSAFHTPGYPWKAGSPFLPPDFPHKISSTKGFGAISPYMHPAIPEYPHPFYAEHGLAAIYSPYLLTGNTPECETTLLSVYGTQDQRHFLSPAGPIPKHLNTSPSTYDHYRFFQQYHSNLPIPYGFYRPESAFPSYSLRLPSVTGITRDQSSRLLEDATLAYPASSPSELNLSSSHRKHTECEKGSPVPEAKDPSKDGQRDAEEAKMSPRAGSAATGSPGMPSPTNFTQTSQTFEGLCDLSNKAASSGTLERLQQAEQSPTAFKPVQRGSESPHSQPPANRTESPKSLQAMNGDPPAQTGSSNSFITEAPPSSPEDHSRIGPLNLSKKLETNPAATYGPMYASNAQADTLQDLPLNLSVKDLCNAWAPRPALPGPPQGAEPAATPKTETKGSEDRTSRVETPQDKAHSRTTPDVHTEDSSDEQKQTAAVALCQLAAYSPGNVRVADEEGTVQEPTRQDVPTLSATENLEAQCDLRPKGQKRTSQRDTGKSQQGTKKPKLNDPVPRVLTLRRRTRVS